MSRMPTAHMTAVGPVLSIAEARPAVVKSSFRIAQVQKASAGFTVYRVDFQVKILAPDGTPVLQECQVWKRFSDFQGLSKSLEPVHADLGSRQPFFPLVKANYFDRFKDSVIEERRASAEGLLQFASKLRHLSSSQALLAFIDGAAIKRILPAVVPSTHSTSLPPPQTDMPNAVPSTTSTSGDKLSDNRSSSSPVASANSMAKKELPAPTESDQAEPRSQTPPSGLEKPVPQEGSSNGSDNEVEAEDDLPEKQDKESPSLLLSSAKSGGILRVNSMVISEWNVEHTLKLRDEGKSPEILLEEAESGDHSGDDHDDSKNASPVPEAELDLPSTPKPLPLASNGASEMENWWSEALAQNQDMDDFDSLIDKLETPAPPAPCKPETTSKGRASPQKLPAQTLSPRSSPAKDVNRNNRESRETRLDVKKSQSPQLVTERRSSPSIETGAYIVQAGKLITQGLDYEKLGELDEAFDLFKAGVDVLLNGVQTDGNKSRREAVRKKTAEYLQYAEYLQSQLDKKSAVKAQVAKGSPRPGLKPHLLPDFRIIGIIGNKNLLVESRHNRQKFVFKTLHKVPSAVQKKKLNRNPRSKNRSPSQCPYMVRLLHHYETQSSRIFLLLEHVTGGKLFDHVCALRQHHTGRQMEPDKSCATHSSPGAPDSKSQLKKGEENGKMAKDATMHNLHVTELLPEPSDGPSSVSVASSNSKPSDEPPSLDVASKTTEPDMEKMLEELSNIVPPTTSLISTDSNDSSMAPDTEESESGEDSLAKMRRMLLESMASPPANSPLEEESSAAMKDKDDHSKEHSRPVVDSTAALKGSSDADESSENVELDTSTVKSFSEAKASSSSLCLDTCTSSGDQGDDDSSGNVGTQITVVPPTPTTPAHQATLPISVPTGCDKEQQQQQQQDSLAADQETKLSPSLTSRVVKTVAQSSGQSTPQFSPGVSLRSSPDLSMTAEQWETDLEDSVRRWASQIVMALDHLHNNAIFCRDLNPSNLLMTESGEVRLTYFGKWDYVPQRMDPKAGRCLYVAPEMQRLKESTPASDWWSLGAILFELLSGESLVSCHPGGVHSHIPITFPSHVSPEARSLISQLLQTNPSERIGSGLSGSEEIKSHPFFMPIEWSKLTS